MGLNAVKTQRIHTASICSQFRLALRQKTVSFDAIAKLIVYINARSGAALPDSVWWSACV